MRIDLEACCISHCTIRGQAHYTASCSLHVIGWNFQNVNAEKLLVYVALGFGGFKLDENDFANLFVVLPEARNGLEWQFETNFSWHLPV